MNNGSKIALFILTCVTFCACKTEEVYFNATNPAPVTIPPYVKTIGIINRSVIADSNGARKAIDEAISAKGPKLDKDCSNESIRGLKDALVQSNMFKNVVFLDSLNLKSNYPGAFPTPLSWDNVQEICKRNNVDAVFVLELFHTGNRITFVPSAAGLTVSAVATIANSASVGTTVNTGWRIYDPQGKVLLDEFPMAQTLNSGGGLLSLGTVESLMDHKEAVMGASYQLGQAYASRILPYVIRVCRQFYIKGNVNFKIARRMADAGDWSNAQNIWNKETNNPKPKIRARAYYNMAIMSEMNGDVDGAIGWAQKSYETKGKRLALIYLNILQYRKAENDQLKAQVH